MAMGRMPEDGGDELSSVFSEINITPLTDIFLVLLIIFMVGASMAVEHAAGAGRDGSADQGVQVELPKGGAKDVSATGSDVTVAILSDGRVVIDGEEVGDDALAERLSSARGDRERATLIVQADEGVAHGRVVHVMETAREAGFAKLAVATRGSE